MKQKPVNNKFKGTLVGKVLQSKVGVVISNWIFQGMRQMNIYEICLKVSLDIVLVIIFSYLLIDWLPSLLSTIVFSFLLAHTLNWIFNGHIYVLWRYVRPVPTSKEKFVKFVQEMTHRGSDRASLDGIAIFGSYCRGKLHQYSDLDVRFVVKDVVLNGIFGAAYCLFERFIAFFKRFPLDIYCCVGMNGMEKLSEDEIPVVLFDRSGLLGKQYPDSVNKLDKYAKWK